jgi:hypothetical protein
MLVLVVLFFLVAFAIFALFLRLGVRWVKIPDAGWGRVLAASVPIWFSDQTNRSSPCRSSCLKSSQQRLQAGSPHRPSAACTRATRALF